MQIDNEIIEKCKNNDRRAQHELYKHCFSILMSVCLRYEKNREDAEELLNMGFLKIVTKLDKYQTKIPFEAWIRRIMINTIIDQYRKNKRQNETIEYTDFEDNSFDKHFDYNEADKNFDAESLRKLIRKLPDMSRQVFNMHVLDGYSHKEISDEIGISVGTSKWHVSNARTMLKEMIKTSVDESIRSIAL